MGSRQQHMQPCHAVTMFAALVACVVLFRMCFMITEQNYAAKEAERLLRQQGCPPASAFLLAAIIDESAGDKRSVELGAVLWLRPPSLPTHQPALAAHRRRHSALLSQIASCSTHQLSPSTLLPHRVQHDLAPFQKMKKPR